MYGLIWKTRQIIRLIGHNDRYLEDTIKPLSLAHSTFKCRLKIAEQPFLQQSRLKREVVLVAQR